ncbi:modification methylase EcoRV [Methylophaga aminisulfidivorans MP]|uniref:Site-specific DNA-methyltransferase (adenine-specific) n=1 Tax=Methylophaga aminisulfidivorans MP TaxID=1026882 RepID=F5SZQ9_9GAMM|nr:DNA adenine methylase [Methylophaga aminisulfidivorans]EGL54486.1 modification methylase EcoRV [Methylophaga aminisulfidivorans MP]
MTRNARVVKNVPSLIKWTGSKRSQAYAISQLAPNFNRYIEPFLGSGAILHTAAHPGALGNDIYKPLIDLWCLVRDNPEELVNDYSVKWQHLNEELLTIDHTKLNSTRTIPEYYYSIRKKFNESPNALDLNFLMRTCVNGIVRFNDKGEFNNSFHLSRKGMQPERFSSIVHAWNPLLNGVSFTNTDYKECLAQATKGDFVYLDPPYAATKSRYASLLEPEELFSELEQLSIRGVNWALSYDGKRGDTDLTQDLPKELYTKHLYLNSGNSAVKKVLSGPIENVQEALYINY